MGCASSRTQTSVRHPPHYPKRVIGRVAGRTMLNRQPSYTSTINPLTVSAPMNVIHHAEVLYGEPSSSSSTSQSD